MAISTVDKMHWSVLRGKLGVGRSPRERAYAIHRLFGINHPPIDVEDICKRLDVIVEYRRQPGWSGAVTSNAKDGTARIWINADEARVRQRFTLAHELGHLMIHPIGTLFRDSSFRGNPQETEANKFAAGLLMPMWMLDRFSEMFGYDVPTLAVKFEVSQHALKIQLSELSGIPVKW